MKRKNKSQSFHDVTPPNTRSIITCGVLTEERKVMSFRFLNLTLIHSND